MDIIPSLLVNISQCLFYCCVCILSGVMFVHVNLSCVVGMCLLYVCHCVCLPPCFLCVYQEEKDQQWKQAMDYLSAVTELNYMTQIVIMLYEDNNKVSLQKCLSHSLQFYM